MKKTKSNKNRLFSFLSSVQCASFSLTIMSLLVSIVSVMTGIRQCSNDEIKMMPLIQINHSLYKSFNEVDGYDSEKVEFVNVGGYGTEFNISKYTFLFCEYYDLKSKPRKLYIPILNLLDITFPTGNFTGVIETSYTVKNLKYYNTLFDEARKVKGGLKIELIYYYKVDYLDFKGKYHSDFYSSNTVFQGHKIQVDKQQMNLLNSYLIEGDYIQKVSIKMILKKLGFDNADEILIKD